MSAFFKKRQKERNCILLRRLIFNFSNFRRFLLLWPLLGYLFKTIRAALFFRLFDLLDLLSVQYGRLLISYCVPNLPHDPKVLQLVAVDVLTTSAVIRHWSGTKCRSDPTSHALPGLSDAAINFDRYWANIEQHSAAYCNHTLSTLDNTPILIKKAERLSSIKVFTG